MGRKQQYQLVIVDDEEQIREGLKSCYPWEQLGFETVGCFSDGKSALDYIERFCVDVVLCDIRMPRMSGLELVRNMRGQGIEAAVVFLSGFAEFEYAREAIRYGVKEYILKPIQYDAVISIFSKIREELDVIQGRSILEDKPVGYYNRIVEQVGNYLQENYASASLEEAAVRVSLSPNYLSKIYKRKTGKNFSESLLEVKMNRAALLLRDTDLKTYEVAEQLGYDNPKNFTRAFKTWFGASPRDYKNQESGV